MKTELDEGFDAKIELLDEDASEDERTVDGQVRVYNDEAGVGLQFRWEDKITHVTLDQNNINSLIRWLQSARDKQNYGV